MTAAIATNRFGLGARPGELAAAGKDPRGWLREQIRKPQKPSAEVAALPGRPSILEEFFDRREMRNELKTAQSGQPNAAAAKVAESVRKNLVPHYMNQAAARVRMAATTDASFHERLVQFWTNHFAISVDK